MGANLANEIADEKFSETTIGKDSFFKFAFFMFISLYLMYFFP